MHSDGEIIARVEEVSGTGDARAGILIRGQHNSVFIALSCDRQGKIWFERRPDPDRKETFATSIATMPPPVWLRLQKQEKTITASCSQDGQTWQRLSDTTRFVAENTWREAEGNLQLLRGTFGLFASARGKDNVCTARVAQVSMTLHGLLGEYFSGRHFEQFRFARLDPQINFRWGSGSPDPLLDNDNFSVRWTGQLVPRKSGSYGFYFDADDDAHLWIDGEEVPRVVLAKPDNRVVAVAPRPVALTAGKPVAVRMEYTETDEAASVKLAWSMGPTREIIGLTNFVFSFLATNAPERTLAKFATDGLPPLCGVLLRDGTFLSGPVTTANESAVRISFAGRKDAPVLNSRVGRIVLRPPRQPLAYEITTGRSGVFLRNRDFLESEFRGIQWGSLTMSSVLFGLKRFGDSDVLVVVLNDCAPLTGGYEVQLLDGSVFRTKTLSANERGITLDEPLLGRLSFATSDLFEIRRTAHRTGGTQSLER
jgi:hypothetical protein